MALIVPKPEVALVKPQSGTPTPELSRLLNNVAGSLQTQIDSIAQAQADSAEAISGVVALSGSLDGKQDASPELDAITELSSNGFTVFTANETWEGRTFADSVTIGWTNPAGESGNPSADFIGTTSDVPEGSNLYYTDARADARIEAQKGVALGLATLDASAKLDGSQLPALAITETSVVASEAAMLALTAQEGDVAVRSDLSKSFILTASPASTLANWQELLSPTSAVSSVFGRTGSVTAQTGDYTAAQVGAQPADATLTALAGLTTAANKAPVFTGTDTATTISLSSGVYSPTLTGVSNIDSVSGAAAQWLRVGNVVTVGGKFAVDPTATGTLTEVGISLPIASNFTSNYDCGGMGASGGVSGQTGQILADVTNDRAQFIMTPADANNRTIAFTFTYSVM